MEMMFTAKGLACRGTRSRLMREVLLKLEREARPQEQCSSVVAGVVARHRASRKDCTSRHKALRLALILCFLYRLDDSELVSDLLSEMFVCEGSFEGLFAGAIFGVTGCYFISGTKSDFASRSENADAVEYFLLHSNASRRTFGDRMRLEEVPLAGVGLTPLAAALDVGDARTASLLLQFAVDPVPRNDTLLAICRRRIRGLLHQNWALPSGIRRLPLPDSLLGYLELDYRDYIRPST